MIEIDGSYGEGGGQVLRSSLSLSAITGQPVRLFNIRSGRAKPGLQPQHLTSVRAAGQVCGAEIEGDRIGSQTLVFRPGHLPRAGDYVFDVSDARSGGSAGSVTLILQTVLLPLALAQGESNVTIRGGTHVPFSPPFPYIRHVYLPVLWRMGIRAQADLKRYGWYPAGGGEIEVKIQSLGSNGREGTPRLGPVVLSERGDLRRAWGTAAVSNLPSHIAQRMAGRAANLLKDAGVKANIEATHVEATGPGTGIFIILEYEHTAAGFTAYGRKGLPSEQVAGMACFDAAAYLRSGLAADMHLSDQLVLPAAVAAHLDGGADRQSRWTTCRITQHLITNAWVVRHFLDVPIQVNGRESESGEVIVGGP